MFQRDVEGFPLCPGPLHINNCLWKYSRKPRARRCLVARDNPRVQSRAFQRQSNMFGSTRNEILKRYDQEKFAYYGLVSTDSIVDKLNMCNTFIPNTSVPVYDTWLQTVNMT